MKKLLLFFTALLFTLGVSGQNASQYAFGQSTTTYTAISGGTAITPTGTTYFDDYSYGPLTIGFNFTWRGTVYTQFGLNENGFISMGATAPSSSYYSLSTGTTNEVIAAFNYDLYGVVANGAEIRYQTMGSAPNRYLVVQFKNYGFYSAGLADFNFQIQLYETTNQVKIVYGPYAGTSISNTVQVGLRGGAAADFNNRTTTTNWSATTAGATNAATCSYTPPGVIPPNGLTFTWTPPPPCATPGAQPTALVLTPTTTTVSGSFTASPSADSYLVVRSLSSSLGASPVDGTVYTVGATLGSGNVVSWGSTTTFLATGLSSSTLYYFFVFAANNSCVGTPPLYLATSPLTGSTTTLTPTPRCGNYTVGPTGAYPSLTAAFADLASNGVTCAVNLQLQSTYVSTVETFPITATAIPGTSAVNKVTVYPLAAGTTITSNNTTSTLSLSGVKYLTIDGRVNATGSTPNLVLDNTGAGASVMLLEGAQYNTVQYCVVTNINAGAYGSIHFGGTSGVNGNSYNVIDHNDIKDGATTPLFAIASNGNAAQYSAYNLNNTISNNNIHDFYLSGNNPIGVYIAAGSSAWTITGNSFYQTVPRSPTVAVGYNVILIVPGDGYTVTNNYIGGSAPLCGGTPWTLNGNGTPPTIANFIYSIRFQTSVLSLNPNIVTGNTVANIALYTNPTAASIFFTGFIGVAGILNLNNNTVGAATGTGSISITVGNGSYAAFFEGLDFRGIQGTVNNNTVGAITMQGVAGSASTYLQTFRAIGVTPSVQNGNVQVQNNLVGSLTTASSLQAPAQSNPYMAFQGLVISATGAGTMTVNSNTCANWTNLNTGISSYNLGIYNLGSMIPSVITSNTVRDFSIASLNTTLAGLSSNVGIFSSNSQFGNIIRGNQIYNLSNTSAGAAVAEHGIYLANTAGSVVCEKNFIHSFSLSSGMATALMTGMYLNTSGAYGTYKNNMIRLGINSAGTSMGDNAQIIGIYEFGATRDSILNNSVYIGGTVSAGTTGNTYAFNSTITTLRTVLDNIFFNARSGGTTGQHYAIGEGGTTMFPFGLNSNYNLLLSNGAVGSMFGRYNALDVASIGAWRVATGNDLASGSGDPNFVAPTGTSATVNLHVQSPTPIEASGIALTNVSDDFDAQTRSTLTPPDVGADAGNFTLSADVFPPYITYTALGNGPVAGTRTLTGWATITDNVGVSTGASLPRIYYKKSTDANAFVGNTSANNGWKYVLASNSSTPFSFTIDYSLLQAPVAAGDIIQYFVVAQDAANNLGAMYPGAGASGNPPVQNINLAPTTVQSYTIVASVPTTITVPGTYATLTGAGGAFDMINQGVITGNTTINITADLTEPGTVGLNQFSEEPPNSNFTLTIKPDASTLRTISGTATLAAGTGLIRFLGADRVTIDGQSGKYLTWRFTNATASGTGPTIQYKDGAINDVLTNCTIENNGTTSTNGVVNISNTAGVNAFNSVTISNNNIGDAVAGTVGRPYTSIYSATNLNTLTITGNNIYNFSNYGVYLNAVNDGATITGNSFYYNNATVPSATQYCIYVTGNTGHTITGNFLGGSAANCGGAAWTTTTTWEGIYCIPSTAQAVTNINNNTLQNIILNTGGTFYGIYAGTGLFNVNNNTIGHPTTLNSVQVAGGGYIYAIYLYGTALYPNNVQGNIIAGLTGTTVNSALYTYGIYISSTNNGLYNIGTVAGNVIGSNTIANSIVMADNTSNNYGIINYSTNNLTNIENNIIANWQFTATSGSPNFNGIRSYAGNLRKNKIFNVSVTTATITPILYGIYNYGVAGGTGEFSNNFISLNGAGATDPTIYGIYDYDAAVTTCNYRYYFNSVSVNGPATGVASTYAYYRAYASTITMNNNIFSNTRAAGGTGKHYGAYIASTGSLNSNYNDIYSTAGYVGYYNAADVLSFAAWKAATLGDANSVNADPQFVSASDLHTVKPELNNAGITIPGITTDFSGAARGNPPDMGLYEFSLVPVITTTAANPVGGTTATLNGQAQPNGEITTVSFEYGLTVAYGTPQAGSPSPLSGATLQNFSGNISGLTPVTLYHFRAKGVANAITYNGLDMTFTTAAIPPTVVTNPATAIASTGATLNGTVTANNSSTTVTFEYGLTAAYGSTINAVPLTVNGMVATAVAANVTGLLPCTLYHFRVKGVNVAGTSNGGDLTFTTLPGAPTASTQAATGVGSNNATLNGLVTSNCASTTVTFNYGLTPAYGNTVPGVPSPFDNGTTPVAVSASLTGLLVGSTYHFQVCGTNANGTNCGTDMTFTTGCPVPGDAGPITGPISVCKSHCNYIYSVAPITNAISYIWTLPPGGSITAGAGSTTISVCFSGAATSGNVTVAGSSGCATGVPSSLPITVNNIPAPTIAGPANGCTGSQAVYTTQAGFANYVWTVSAGGSMVTGNGTNTLTVMWNTAGAQNVSVNYTNAQGCDAAAPTVYPVTVNNAPVPTISGLTSMCVNSGYYNYTTEAGMSNYIWTVSPGGMITFGGNTYQAQVEWIAPGPQWISVNYNNANGCAAPTPTVLNVNVQDIPAPAGNITGTSTVCGGGTGSYSVDPILNALTYVWTLPAGANITGGAGTNSITVTFDANASSGDVTVYGNNLCGNGTVSPAFPITVSPLPDQAGPITGQAAVCDGDQGIVYSVAPIANATGYVWPLPGGVTIVDGYNTNVITVNFAPGTLSGDFMVYGTNACGYGDPSPDFYVTVNPIPPKPVITLNGYVLSSDAPSGNQWYKDDVLQVGATGQTLDATTTGSGWYYDVVTSLGCASPQSDSLYVLITGLPELPGSHIVIYPVPNDGHFTISISNQVTTSYKLEIYNAIGMMVYSDNNMVVNRSLDKKIDLSTASDGVYTVILKDNSNRVIRTILINK
ncbi:MAG TPA: T9SS type A sorting domain-containing protein [Bacteroidales bacterium]|nr:T9SS type A sorting domain-containing protein [Bacteroidales bacterium]